MKENINDKKLSILEILQTNGSLNASDIFRLTNIGSKDTLYKAIRELEVEKQINEKNKKFSINIGKFQLEKQPLRAYEEYENLIENFNEMLTKISDNLKGHRRILDNTEQDRKLARKIIHNSEFYQIIDDMVKIFQIGSVMEFFINSGMLTKTIQNRAISLRRKNELNFSKFLELLKNMEPIFWAETITLIHNRLVSNIYRT